jgi:hypothetical protein
MEEEYENAYLTKLSFIKKKNKNKKDCFSFEKKIYFKYFDILLFIINIILYILYIISLEDCNKGEEDGCVDDNIPTFIFQGVLVEINALIYSLEFFFMVLHYVNKFHLIYIILFYYYQFKKKNGYTLQFHGGFNKDILILSLIVYLIIEFFIII